MDLKTSFSFSIYLHDLFLLDPLKYLLNQSSTIVIMQIFVLKAGSFHGTKTTHLKIVNIFLT